MSDVTRLTRLVDRGSDDREVIDSILDEAFVCHLGYVIEGRPVVLPTLYVRDGDRILLHGSNSMGMAKAVRAGSPLCATVTIVDGLVVARSAFHSSANYRSVVVHGTGTILDGDDRARALEIVIDGLIPGRLDDIRASTEAEIRQTTVIEMGLDTASAKTRSGGPVDDPADIPSATWAGVIPIATVYGEPEPADDMDPHIPAPDYLGGFRR